MIIAVDFDGVLCEDIFPEIGQPNYDMISFIRQLIDENHEVILWTCRVDDALVQAVKWCNDRGLHFSAVNENAPSNIARWIDKYPNGTRKVYADIYIDDHDPFSLINSHFFGHNDTTKHIIKYTRRSIQCHEEK